MCMGKAYLETGTERQLLMEDLATIEVEGNTVHLSNLFGEHKEVEATITEVDFQDGKITLTA